MKEQFLFKRVETKGKIINGYFLCNSDYIYTHWINHTWFNVSAYIGRDQSIEQNSTNEIRSNFRIFLRTGKMYSKDNIYLLSDYDRHWYYNS